MYTISSDQLSLHILDPVADRERMGPRYCTGGYIFQIEEDGTALLSGPTYPEDFNWFDGQGIPDSFAQSPIKDQQNPGTEALIPGIGVCDLNARTVIKHCEWDVDVTPNTLSFSTSHAFQGFALRIEREVNITGRVVCSATTVTNTGRGQIPLRWFPHPFYPVPDEPNLCSMPGPLSLPGGTPYSVGEDGYLRCSDISAAKAVPLSCNMNGPLTILQRHPILGIVSARYSFAAGHVLVWGNKNTFSFEPYLEQTIGADRSLNWTAEYHF